MDVKWQNKEVANVQVFTASGEACGLFDEEEVEDIVFDGNWFELRTSKCVYRYANPSEVRIIFVDDEDDE